MLPNIKIVLPCLLLCSILVGRTNGFGHQPKGGWGPLWLNDTNPGEIDMLGDLPVHRSNKFKQLFHHSQQSFICLNVGHHRYGPASNAKWVLWGHDIFGVLSGWHTINCFATLHHDLFRKRGRKKETSCWIFILSHYVHRKDDGVLC